MIWNHACHSYSKLWYRINTKQWREGNFQKCNIWISSHLDLPISLSSWVINNLLFAYCIVSISNPCVGFGVPIGLEECGVSAVLIHGARAPWRCVEMLSITAKTALERKAPKTHRVPHLWFWYTRSPTLLLQMCCWVTPAKHVKTSARIEPMVVIQRTHIYAQILGKGLIPWLGYVMEQRLRTD